MKQAWFCPSCQKHHAPHCDTCPGPTTVSPFTPVQRPVVVPSIWPSPGTAPQPGRWVPPHIITCGVTFKAPEGVHSYN